MRIAIELMISNENGDSRRAPHAELEELPVNARRPRGGLAAFILPNKITSLATHRRPSCSRTPAPKEAEALTARAITESCEFDARMKKAAYPSA
jgi:hypothetical protein